VAKAPIVLALVAGSVLDGATQRFSLRTLGFGFQAAAAGGQGRASGSPGLGRQRHAVDNFVQAHKSIESVHLLGAVLSAKAMSRALTSSGKDEAWMSKRRWMALDTLLTFCPPAPWARMADTSTSASKIISEGAGLCSAM
jgi:hypothetical protein